MARRTAFATHNLPLYTSEQMRRTDAAAIDGIGIPGVVLMERAGIAVAEYLLDHYCEHHRYLVLAGKGNNGGDGFVAARHLAETGADVRVYCTAAAGEYKGDALVNLKAAKKLGIKFFHAPSRATLARALASDCIIVDAVFGTGFSGEPRGRAADFIETAAAAAERRCLPVVAVDIASGVDAATGEAASNSLPADATVTFHVPKVGHFAAPGGYLSGDVILADIGIPQAAGVEPDHFLVDPRVVATVLPQKLDHDHKFSCGRVLVVGGSTGLTGAPCLAASAALRAGAGVVTAAVPASLNPVFEQKLTAVMTLALEDGGRGALNETALPALLEAAARFDCLALGPGLGRDPATAALVRRLLAQADMPVVLDADGLGAVAGRPGTIRKRRAATVLTPHAGELGRLLGRPADTVAASALASAREAARRTGAVVVLKGANSIITDGSWTLINPSGNPGLATAGSGDVLTGVVASLLARGLEPLAAAAAGVYLHGAAADLAAAEGNTDNLVSTDLLGFLPRAFAEAGEE